MKPTKTNKNWLALETSMADGKQLRIRFWLAVSMKPGLLPGKNSELNGGTKGEVLIMKIPYYNGNRPGR